MGQKRDNAIILLVDPPEADKINQDLKTAFGPERAAHVNSDLLAAAYKLAKNFGEAILILSYAKTSRHPDLTWLDPEDPGFLEVKSHSYEDRLQDAFRLAFFTGAKKAVLINHLSPELKAEWIGQAFDAVSDKAVALGANQDGSFYLIGLTQQNLRVFETPGFSHGKSAEALAERAKKQKLAVTATPETYSVTGEESLLKWMESKETLPPLFQAPQAASAGEQKKHPRRRDRHHENQAQPPETPAV
ncbi:MAG: DUF2064 domain-containing protein [Elusimicrobiales bacterium]|nr:DUF2064 domain-containing protein [Elusimicrobiales bacterium]